MSLKDFDLSKITNWRYSQVGTKQKSQTFEDGHSGTRVDGARDLILEKFLNSPEESKPDASQYDIEQKPQTFEANGYTVTGTRDIISGKFVNDPKTILIGDDTIFEPNKNDTPLNDLTQQQNYTVDNAGGSYQMTGKGAFDTGNLTEIDKLKGLSLIISNWADMVDAKTLISYKIARSGKNATHGHLEIPYSYKNFGSTATDAEAFSYGSLSPNIGWTVELGRGADAVEGVVKDYKKILESGGMWKRFVQKQSDMQAMGTITIGSVWDGLFEAPFDTFNSLDYLVALGSTAQPYRLGSIMAGVPRYTEHTPMMIQKNEGVKIGNFPLPGTGWYDDIDKWMSNGDAINFNKSKGKDFHKDSKMLYLYKSFILTDPEEVAFGSEDWALGFMTNYWNSINDPYPIAPSMNIVQSKAWTNKNLVYGGKNSDDTQRKYATMQDKGSTIAKDLSGKYSFYSKSVGSYDLRSKSKAAAAYLKDSYANEEKLIAAKQDIIDEDGSNVPYMFPGLKQQLDDITIDDPGGSFKGQIPISVKQSLGGENTLEKFSKNTRGLVNKYSTLGYTHLGNEIKLKDGDTATKKINYERTLHSPSEINNLIEVDIGPEADAKLNPTTKEVESGIRFDGRRKVYGIGNQGMRTTFADDGTPSQLNPTPNIYGFKGYINKDAIGVFGDHVDKVNALPYGESNNELDFVSLIFKDVYNKKDIQFRALFTEDITDTISPSWNPINYIGRTTSVYTYQNTARSIGFGFTIFPKTKQEFPILLEKVNYLVGMCYPNLDDYFRASGPLIKLTVGDIVKNQLGFLSECAVTFPSSASPWETDRGLQFTKKIDISIGFTYIGNNIPVAKGVHYNLDWLDGEHYTEAGVAWKDGPTRKTGGTVSNLDMEAIYADTEKGLNYSD
jgi:hypothetical protein